VDYAFLDTWRVTGVVVPVFRPAVLPRSAIAGAAAVDRIPFIDESTRLLLHAEREYAELLGDRTVVSNLDVQLPPFDVRNFQYALRVGGVLFGQDVGLSYYYGRTDIPQPIRQHVSQNFAVDCSGVPD